MLTDRELVEALIVNLSSWDWTIESKFGIDQKTGEALVSEFKKRMPDFDCAVRD